MTRTTDNNQSNPKTVQGRSGQDKVYIILTIILISACAVAYFLLSISPVCDYDESYTVSMISHTFGDIVSMPMSGGSLRGPS